MKTPSGNTQHQAYVDDPPGGRPTHLRSKRSCWSGSQAGPEVLLRSGYSRLDLAHN